MNPLRAYFRQPNLYLSLPSDGKFWPADSIDIPINRELPVLSMTAMDEILLRTPDALFNGDAVVKLIQNCIPSIRDAWQMPMIDFEAALLAIRIASTGENFAVTTTCPQCEQIDDFDIDLKSQLSSIQMGDWSAGHKVNELTIFYRPLSFKEMNDINIEFFKYQKQLTQLDQIEDRDQREEIQNQLISQLNSQEMLMVVQSIRMIQIQGQVVDNPDFLQEFILNCDKKIYDQIKGKVLELRQTLNSKDCDFSCSNCSHNYKSTFTIDYTSFFD